jgi:hypothetical protein
MNDDFFQGAEVLTHSLTTVQYNDLLGTIAGSAVEKNAIMRFPVSLRLNNGERKNMMLQPKNLTLVKDPQVSPLGREEVRSGSGQEMKECRCMFCGESLQLGSEDEAIAHMEVCPALQEQLDDTEHQFTLPESMK